jgi:iron complex transport system permease protein
VTAFVSASGKRVTARRLLATIALAGVACGLVALLAPLIGRTLDGHLELYGFGAYDAGSPDHAIVAVRLPRVMAALLVGAALGGAGCALQALLRNPLAEPFTLGISSGSSLAAVIALRFGLGALLGGWGVSAAALVGAVVALLVVERLARVGRHLPPATLVLSGVTISMLCSSISVILMYTASDFAESDSILNWMVGGFDTSRIVQAEIVAAPVIAALLGLVACARSLDALVAGPEVAASLGVSVGRTQVVVFALSSLLVGISVALAGPIGFVGLVVPHALRGLLGPDHRVLVPASMFGGAALLVVCDTVARIVAPSRLPAGAVTAVLGGAFFLAILIRHKRRAAMWGRA